MALPNVALNDPHVAAHNNERAEINAILEAMEAFVELEGAPNDGQALVWSQTLGKWTPANPSGASELAYAENVTGTVTSLATSAAGGLSTDTAIPGCSIVVPISTRPVWVHYQLTFLQNQAGAGTLFVAVKEGSTTVSNHPHRLPASADATQNTFTVRGKTRIGPVAAPRTLQLRAQLYTPTNVVAAGNVLNGATFNNGSAIMAEAK